MKELTKQRALTPRERDDVIKPAEVADCDPVVLGAAIRQVDQASATVTKGKFRHLKYSSWAILLAASTTPAFAGGGMAWDDTGQMILKGIGHLARLAGF
jgi:hypothetical protein